MLQQSNKHIERVFLYVYIVRYFFRLFMLNFIE